METIRLAALGIHHESNTFARNATGLDEINAAGLLIGDAIVEFHEDAESTMAGFLEARSLRGVEVVPLLFTFPNPAGPISNIAFESVVGKVLRLLEEGGPWDGVLMAQHGAAVSELFADADAEIVARVRRTIGARTRIGVALDLHGNISHDLVGLTDIVVGYRTNPHVDARIRGLECAELLVGMIRGREPSHQFLVRLPLVSNIMCQSSLDQPFKSLYESVAELVERPGIMTASVFEGYPYADVPQMGMSCLVAHRSDPGEAKRAATTLGRQVWGIRHELDARGVAPRAAVDAAAATKGPTLLLDMGDNIGAGSPGNSVVILDQAISANLASFIQTSCEPAGVARCIDAGLAQSVELELGPMDSEYGRRLTVRATVERLSDGHFYDPGITHGGQRYFNAGPSALVVLEGGQRLILNSILIMNSSVEQLRSMGVQPEEFRAVVAKGVHSPRASYGDIVNGLVFVDTPGVTRADFTSLPYSRRPKPLFPFEESPF